MTPDGMADIMARAYVGRPWSAEEIARLAAEPGGFAVSDPRGGFALGRVVAGEAELLMIAVTPEAQGQGIGRKLLHMFMCDAAARGATEVFLEVAADNRAAQALYHAGGFSEVGRRAGYYPRPDGTRVDAVVMRAQAVP